MERWQHKYSSGTAYPFGNTIYIKWREEKRENNNKKADFKAAISVGAALTIKNLKKRGNRCVENAELAISPEKWRFKSPRSTST